MALISPGVEVTIIDESFYIAGAQTALPLIFIATEAEKTQLDGKTPAIGTYEHGVLRVVTSIKQALELYGMPRYLTAEDGTPHHGDVRNEYGLDALLKYLEIGNRAYVIRANVNLNDDPVAIRDLWQRKVEEAANTLEVLIEDYIESYNTLNEYYPTDLSFYKTTVTSDELKELVVEVMQPVFDTYSFSKDRFYNYFMDDHTQPKPGYQDVMFNTSRGFLQLSDVTGLKPALEYTALVDINGNNPIELTVLGANAQTFGALVNELNNQLGSDATAALIAGRLRITSPLTGVTSSVEILSDGGSGLNALFASLNLYRRIAEAIPGVGTFSLIVYDDDGTVLGSYDGFDDLVQVDPTYTAQAAVALLIDAAAMFDGTNEFKSTTALGANDALRRIEVVRAVSEVINNPLSGIRSADALDYNITIAPGFPECSDELIRLSEAMLEEVFVIGETPFDKPPTGPNGINLWAATPARATSYHISYAYPHGISTNIDGRQILTSAAGTTLRVFAYNDLNAELWFAPAGTQRGRCNHLETIGYVSGALGGPTTFVEDYIDVGTRDELYSWPRNINPIAFIPGRGILVMGQKTTHNATSALDRINVSRLVKYIKRELRRGLFPYLFEPNDKYTWREVTFTCNGFLGSLISRRGLYDFGVKCDEDNNTPDSIDRHELWVDIAVKPVKSIEFIYVPIRVVNTGTDISAYKGSTTI